jgi:hypothetical protein
MRILLREMPLMLREMLSQALIGDGNAEIITEPPLAATSPQLIAPDVVICATEDPSDANGAPALLERWPLSQVLLIATDGHQATLYELQPRRTALGEMSIPQLLEVVSQVTRDAGRKWVPWKHT